ncbi:MAG: hydroxymethylbilane synthase [Deltaproteobacteria bacterium]|nr:hydroxymethylbilane synthase [Deltaproteobacteria bacterium]
MKSKTIKIGTRGSPLALRQSTWVKETLVGYYPRLEIEMVAIKTTGDKILDVPLANIGGKGIFVKEIEEALLGGRFDLAVHSLKDLPGELPEGLTIGAVPIREDARDVLISRNGLLLKEIPGQSKIGTSSLRRQAQLLRYRPDLEMIPLRGNLESRIKKIESEGLAGIILAAAGLNRMGYQDKISQHLDLDICLPAVGQGALALEIRAGDPGIQDLIRVIHHDPTALCTRVERAFLNRLQGGCQVPVAGHARVEEGRIIFQGLIADRKGRTVIQDQIEGTLSDPASLGIRLAERLLDRGGREILEDILGEQV